MFVPTTARRSVIFLGDLVEQRTFRPRGTAFLVAVPILQGSPPVSMVPDAGHSFCYLVTAAHLVDGLSKKQIYYRVNRKDGTAQVKPLRVSKWWYHPNPGASSTDVAVAPVHVNFDRTDHDAIPLFDNVPSLSQRHIGLGDEIFAIGLFKHHAGNERNEPIIRIGNIAAFPEEPVFTKLGNMHAYLIDMMSIGGLSGSPVFVNRTETGIRGAYLMKSDSLPQDREQVSWSKYTFLGLIHGHFDIKNLIEDSVLEDDAATSAINSGIGVVVPERYVIETLYQPGLVEERRRLAPTYEQLNPLAIPDEF
jgi:hypothetical protein